MIFLDVTNHAKMLREQAGENAHVITFTYRDVGASTGKFKNIQDLGNDITAIVNYLCNQGIPAHNIVCYGHSLGGVAAVDAVNELHKNGIKCHLRLDRSIAHIDGFIPDRFVSRTPWVRPINSIMRCPIRMALRLHGLYSDTASKWHQLPNYCKDFRQIIDDGMIPHDSSFAQEEYEATGNYPSNKVIDPETQDPLSIWHSNGEARHCDWQFISVAWNRHALIPAPSGNPNGDNSLTKAI